MLGAGDMLAQFNPDPEAVEFMKFMATAEAQAIWVGELGKLGTNSKIDPAVYPDDLTRAMAEALAQAEIFRFDGSDCPRLWDQVPSLKLHLCTSAAKIWTLS